MNYWYYVLCIFLKCAESKKHMEQWLSSLQNSWHRWVLMLAHKSILSQFCGCCLIFWQDMFYCFKKWINNVQRYNRNIPPLKNKKKNASQPEHIVTGWRGLLSLGLELISIWWGEMVMTEAPMVVSVAEVTLNFASSVKYIVRSLWVPRIKEVNV